MQIPMFVHDNENWSCEVGRRADKAGDYFVMTIKCKEDVVDIFLESFEALKIIRNQLQKQINEEAPGVDNE